MVSWGTGRYHRIPDGIRISDSIRILDGIWILSDIRQETDIRQYPDAAVAWRTDTDIRNRTGYPVFADTVESSRNFPISMKTIIQVFMETVKQVSMEAILQVFMQPYKFPWKSYIFQVMNWKILNF